MVHEAQALWAPAAPGAAPPSRPPAGPAGGPGRSCRPRSGPGTRRRTAGERVQSVSARAVRRAASGATAPAPAGNTVGWTPPAGTVLAAAAPVPQVPSRHRSRSSRSFSAAVRRKIPQAAGWSSTPVTVSSGSRARSSRPSSPVPAPRSHTVIPAAAGERPQQKRIRGGAEQSVGICERHTRRAKAGPNAPWCSPPGCFLLL